jgi:aspartyl-tRNA(Asn)/glutamyl-tRNA(Gln) amidotransferase subunit A
MQKHYRGVLHGIPFSVKDQICTENIRTTCGSPLLADFVPKRDATVVMKLRKAGAVLLGKSNMNEFALGDAIRTTFGEPRNPWDSTRRPGSSSSGSAAAVAAGLCAMSIGVDTGGSIRGPAAYTGTVGLRPSPGIVSRAGLLGLSFSLDTLGPITRTVEDCAITLSAIVGHDPRDSMTRAVKTQDYSRALTGDIRGVRVGVLTDRLYGIDPVDPDIKRSVKAAVKSIAKLGASTEEVSLSLADQAALVAVLIMMVEGARLHRPQLVKRLAEYDHNVKVWLLAGAIMPAQLFYAASSIRSRVTRELLTLLTRVDVLLLPTTSIPPPRVGRRRGIRSQEEAKARFGGTRNLVALASLAGVPAISVPCGFTSKGLPVGLQLIGRRFDEGTLLRVAHAYQQSNTWHLRHPPAGRPGR